MMDMPLPLLMQATNHVRVKAAAHHQRKEPVRRLTSGEYGYAIEDLTGLKLDTEAAGRQQCLR